MKLELEFNRAYSTDEFKKIFGFKAWQWKNDKEKVLEYLKEFFNYEIIKDEKDKRKTNYVVHEQLKEYIPYSKVILNKKARTQLFEKKIVEVVLENKRQTSKNIARIISPAIYKSLNIAESTTYDYVRQSAKELFGVNGNVGRIGKLADKKWCKLDKENNVYIPMSKHEMKIFRKFIDIGGKTDEEKEYVLNLTGELQSDFITEEEYDNKIRTYNLYRLIQGQKMFLNKYGYWPTYVACFELNGINKKEIERILNSKI